MTRNHAAAGIAAVVIAAGAAVGIASCGTSSHKPVRDNDGARDCWAHPDKTGSRHCPTGGKS